MREADKAGIGSALLASVCCIGPLLLAALGLGGLGLGVFIGEYHWYFISTAIAVLAYAWYSYARERRRCATQQCEMVRGKVTRITLSLASAAVALFLGLNLYTYAGTPAGGADTQETADLTQVVLPVEGMTCFTCTMAVEKSLHTLEGVREAEASVPEGSVRVSFDAGRVTLAEMIATVNETGFRARLPDSRGQG